MYECVLQQALISTVGIALITTTCFVIAICLCSQFRFPTLINLISCQSCCCLLFHAYILNAVIAFMLCVAATMSLTATTATTEKQQNHQSMTFLPKRIDLTCVCLLFLSFVYLSRIRLNKICITIIIV